MNSTPVRNNWRNMFALIVDGDEKRRNETRTLLERANYTVYTAADSDAGIRLIKSTPGVSLVITHLAVPTPADGFEVLKTAQKTERGIRTVLTVTEVTREIETRTTKLGAEGLCLLNELRSLLQKIKIISKKHRRRKK